MGILEIVFGLAGVGSLILAFPKIQKVLARTNLKGSVEASFNFRGMYSEGILLEFNEDQNLAYYEDEGLIAYDKPFLSISLRSTSNSSWVRIAPFAIINVTKIVPAQDVKVYVDMQDGKGGGGMPRYLSTVLLGNKRGRFKAAYLGEDFSTYRYMSGEQNLPDTKTLFHSFTLQPGEVEVFDLDFVIEPGYIFEFCVGVTYIYEEVTHIKWSNIYKVGIAKAAEQWTVKGIKRFSNEWEGGEYPDNYREIGLQKLAQQTYSPPSFDKAKAESLWRMSQSVDKRDYSE